MIDSWKDLAVAIAGYVWFVLFIVATTSAWERWGFVAGAATAAVWIALEVLVVKATVRMRDRARSE